MATKLCTQTLQGYKSVINFHSTFMLVLSVLNLAFSIVATLGNLLVILALRKASSTTLKHLFLSLAVSDLAVALIPQLMLGVNLAVMLHMEPSEKHNIDALLPGDFDYLSFLRAIPSIRVLLDRDCNRHR